MNNLPPLTERTDKGAAGGHEFERLLNQLLLTPHDLTPKGKEWLLAQSPRADLKVHHWGQARIEGLLRECAPKLFSRYDAHEAASAGLSGARTVSAGASGVAVGGDRGAVSGLRGRRRLAGNVWEWCRTKHRENYKDYERKVDDSLTGHSARVLRGGSWHGNAHDARCAYRSRVSPGSRYRFVGFRLVASPFFSEL